MLTQEAIGLSSTLGGGEHLVLEQRVFADLVILGVKRVDDSYDGIGHPRGSLDVPIVV